MDRAEPVRARRRAITEYQQHVLNWRDCALCPLCEQRTQVVLARGSLPCDVLFIGEAPGVSEDSLGEPFAGPAGKLLDRIVEQSIPIRVELGEDGWTEYPVPDTRTAFTNLVACFPREAKRYGDNQPPQESIETCAPRLRELVAIARPKVIVCVGVLAERWVPKLLECGDTSGGWAKIDGNRIPFVSIEHPASILRKNVAVQSLAAQKCVVAIADALEEMQRISKQN